MSKSEKYGLSMGLKKGKEERRERGTIRKKERKSLRERSSEGRRERSWKRGLETKLRHPFLKEKEGELLHWSEDQDHNQPLKANHFQKCNTLHT